MQERRGGRAATGSTTSRAGERGPPRIRPGSWACAGHCCSPRPLHGAQGQLQPWTKSHKSTSTSGWQFDFGVVLGVTTFKCGALSMLQAEIPRDAGPEMQGKARRIKPDVAGEGGRDHSILQFRSLIDIQTILQYQHSMRTIRPPRTRTAPRSQMPEGHKAHPVVDHDERIDARQPNSRAHSSSHTMYRSYSALVYFLCSHVASG